MNIPNQAWVCDITYIKVNGQWRYLAIVLDLYSRKIIGWAMDTHMESTLVCQALTMALLHRGYPSKVIVHSDRGGQYCSDDYQSILTAYGLTCSMSRKGMMWSPKTAKQAKQISSASTTKPTNNSSQSGKQIKTQANVTRG